MKELEKEARMLESTNTKLNNILLLAEKDHAEVTPLSRSC